MVNGDNTQTINFTAGQINNISIVVKNSKTQEDPKIELLGKKVHEGAITESKDFTFKLKEQVGNAPADDDPVIADGKATVGPTTPSGAIVFTKANTTEVIDTKDKWTALLEKGKTYYIVEDDPGADYGISYMIDGTDGNSFTVPANLTGSTNLIEFICTNTKQEKHFKFGAEKKVTGTADLGTKKTFEFIIYEKGDTSKEPVALGTVDVTAKDTDVAITFTTPSGDDITDWKSILADGKTYVLEETTPGYEITYTGGNVANGAPNEFMVRYSADADSAAANVSIHVKNDRNEGWLPSTGGAGTMIFGAVALAAVAAAGGFGFVYWKRNRKA